MASELTDTERELIEAKRRIGDLEADLRRETERLGSERQRREAVIAQRNEALVERDEARAELRECLNDAADAQTWARDLNPNSEYRGGALRAVQSLIRVRLNERDETRAEVGYLTEKANRNLAQRDRAIAERDEARANEVRAAEFMRVAHEEAARYLAQRDRAREALQTIVDGKVSLRFPFKGCTGEDVLDAVRHHARAALADAGAGGEEQGAGGAEAPSDPPRSDPGASAPGRPHPPSPPPPATGGACDPGEWDERLRWHTCRTHPGRVLPADVLASQDPSRPMCVEVPAAESAPAPPDDDCAHDAWTVDSTGGGRRCVDCGDYLPEPPAGGGEWAGSARVLPPQPPVTNTAPPPARGGEEAGTVIERGWDALQGAIDNGNRLCMSIPANPERDHDILIADALNVARALARENAELRERVADWEDVFGVGADPDEVGRTFARALEKQDGRIAALEREKADVSEECAALRDRTTELDRQTRQHRARVDTLERLIEAVPVRQYGPTDIWCADRRTGPWFDVIAIEQAAIRERRGEGE